MTPSSCGATVITPSWTCEGPRPLLEHRLGVSARLWAGPHTGSTPGQLQINAQLLVCGARASAAMDVTMRDMPSSRSSR